MDKLLIDDLIQDTAKLNITLQNYCFFKNKTEDTTKIMLNQIDVMLFKYLSIEKDLILEMIGILLSMYEIEIKNINDILKNHLKYHSRETKKS